MVVPRLGFFWLSPECGNRSGLAAPTYKSAWAWTRIISVAGRLENTRSLHFASLRLGYRVISRAPPILQLKEQVMKPHRYSIVVVLLVACVYGMPAFGVSKEM